MIIEVKHIIFKQLTPNQIDNILTEMRDLAQKKHTELTAAYMSHQTDYPEDMEEMIGRSCWEDLLPSEFHTLIQLKDEQEKRKVS